MRLILLALCLANAAFADDRIDKLTKRIEELERQQEDLTLQLSESNQPKVNSFLKDQLTLGGFFEPSMTYIEGQRTKSQLMNSSNILGLNIASEFSPKLRFVSQVLTGLAYPLQNLQNDPRLTPNERTYGQASFGAVLTQGYVEYSLSDEVKIQGGEGYVPFGFAFQQRELVLFVRRGGPQLMRTGQLVSPLWNGVNLQAAYNKGKNDWGYNLYTTNPLYNQKSMGIGGRVWVSSENDVVTMGLSSQALTYGSDHDQIVGTDVRIKTLSYIITSEYARHFTRGSDAFSYYLEPAMYVYQDQLLFYVFGDYAQSSLNLSSATLADPYRKWEYGAGFNWLPTSYTRFRLGLTMNDYVGTTASPQGRNRDYVSIDTSVGVAF